MRVYFFLIAFQLVGGYAWAQQTITLQGKVMNDAQKPIANTRIALSGGIGDKTDINGAFKVTLSKDYISGERVILQVFKDGWVINHPLDGEWNLPNMKYQWVHTTQIIMVPRGSKALWTHARIEKHVAQLSDQITKLRAAAQQASAKPTEPAPIDFTYHLREWAEKYGFTTDQVKTAFDQWAKEATESEDFRKLGLAAFYQKNFTEAAKNFEQAARQNEASFKAMADETEEKRLATYEDWKSAGEARYLAYQFDSALVSYQKAVALVTIETYPKQWAGIQQLINHTQMELVTRIAGTQAMELLNNVVNTYQQILTVYTKADSPQDWATAQNGLGNALGELGVRADGQQGLDYSKQAVKAFHNALEVYTKADSPQAWAMIQNNLGTVLGELAIRADGQQGLDYSKQAVKAFHNALEVYTKADSPQAWATAQNNLGNVLGDLGTRTSGHQGLDYLQQAIQAFHYALEVIKQTEMQQGWARIQYNLIKSYIKLKRYDQAALAYNKLLEVYPNFEEAYNFLVYYYHEDTFNYPQAYELGKRWLAQFPGSILARTIFVRELFTTARFTESTQQIRTLLQEPKIDVSSRITLRGMLMANAFASKLSQSIVTDQFATLQEEVAKQKPDFAVQWNFNGTKNFINHYPPLAPYRNWLIAFFDALSHENRAAIQGELSKLQDELALLLATLPK